MPKNYLSEYKVRCEHGTRYVVMQEIRDSMLYDHADVEFSLKLGKSRSEAGDPRILETSSTDRMNGSCGLNLSCTIWYDMAR